jgi:prepilin-type processing-associated H-X9-DG protein
VHRLQRRAFTLAELIVVVGVIALLLALLLPPLQIARHHAMTVQCAAHLQQTGIALESAKTDLRFYPLWDDGGTVRYTWIDVLVQQEYLPDYHIGYCPSDLMPDPLNQARGRANGATYPVRRGVGGVDYSYGIGVPLSAGGWRWQPGTRDDSRSRRFEGSAQDTARRVLAGDAYWSTIYNLSGDAVGTNRWNDPAWYDNMLGWRHRGIRANLLMQDGHVDTPSYDVAGAYPVNTSKYFIWHPGESLHVGPDDRYRMQYYPNVPPPNFSSDPRGDMFPDALVPAYYSSKKLWTLIPHK